METMPLFQINNLYDKQRGNKDLIGAPARQISPNIVKSFIELEEAERTVLRG